MARDLLSTRAALPGPNSFRQDFFLKSSRTYFSISFPVEGDGLHRGRLTTGRPDPDRHGGLHGPVQVPSSAPIREPGSPRVAVDRTVEPGPLERSPVHAPGDQLGPDR